MQDEPDPMIWPEFLQPRFARQFFRFPVPGLLLLALFSWGCSPGPLSKDGKSDRSSSEKKKQDSETAPIPVRVEAIRRGPISYSIQTTGNLEAEDWTDLVMRRSGIVETIHVEEGTRVKAGTSLLSLDRKEALLAVAQAEAEKTEADQRAKLSEEALAEAENSVEQARIAAQKAETEYKRYSRLSRGVIQQEELESRQYEKRRTHLALEAAQNAKRQAKINTAIARTAAHKAGINLEKTQLDLDYTILKSPFDGIISERHIQRGQYLAANTRAFTLVNCHDMKLEVNLPQRYLPLFKPELEVSLETEAFKDARFPAILERISPVVGEMGTLKITIRITGRDPRLRPGMYVSASIVIDTHENALLAPKRGVQYDTLGGIPTVFVVREGKAVRLPIQIGFRKSSVLEVLPVLIPTDHAPLFTVPGSLGAVVFLPRKFISVREGDLLIIAGQDKLKGGEDMNIVSGMPTRSAGKTATRDAGGKPLPDRSRQKAASEKGRDRTRKRQP